MTATPLAPIDLDRRGTPLMPSPRRRLPVRVVAHLVLVDALLLAGCWLLTRGSRVTR